jgi:hypothetical protein
MDYVRRTDNHNIPCEEGYPTDTRIRYTPQAAGINVELILF